MKQNEDGKTVRAMDVLFPKIGEIIGGSEREADYEKLSARVHELGMNEKELWLSPVCTLFSLAMAPMSPA